MVVWVLSLVGVLFVVLGLQGLWIWRCLGDVYG